MISSAFRHDRHIHLFTLAMIVKLSGLVAAALLGLLLAANPATGQSSSGQVEASAVFLSPGDAVRIEVWRQAEFSGTFEVQPDGTVAHPLYRGVQVAGTPMSEVERRIGQFLTEFESNPDFVVTGILRIPVTGEVGGRRVHEVPVGTTVDKLITMAGGPTEGARMDRVILRRNGQEHRLDLENSSAGSNQVLHSGDQLFVPRRRNVLRDYVAPASSILSLVVSLVRLGSRL
jgi:polysaccharide biosynthesis/export protein